MERLFNDTSKFTLLQEHPTLCNLSTMQTFLNTLHKRNEITLEYKNLMRSKFAQIGRAYGLPKIHKDYQHIPPFRPIVYTKVEVLLTLVLENIYYYCLTTYNK